MENLIHEELPIDTPRRYFRHPRVILPMKLLKWTTVVFRPWLRRYKQPTPVESIHPDHHNMDVRGCNGIEVERRLFRVELLPEVEESVIRSVSTFGL